ncbi:MAG: TRAP transporter small permease subunit, partial [Alphaproteobacteria bacterium]
MSSALQWLFKAFDVFVVIGMAVISLLIFTNVVLRYGFSSGIPFAVEVSRVVLVWVIFMGSVVALAKGAHLGVESLVVRLPPRARLVCFLVSYGLMLWCCWLLGEGS